jgi:F0F1-type ATP synthase delta subunit
MATYASRIGRPRDFPLLLGALVDLVAKEANRRVADVRSATELTAQQRSRLTAVLTGYTGYPVDVRVTADPQLLGGFVANIGDVVIDASLRHRVELAREALLEPGRVAGAAGPAGAAGGPTSSTGAPEEHSEEH